MKPIYLFLSFVMVFSLSLFAFEAQAVGEGRQCNPDPDNCGFGLYCGRNLGEVNFTCFSCNTRDFGCFEAKIPGLEFDTITELTSGKANPLVFYVGVIANFVTALIVVVGIISIVIGGYFYMTARGNAQQISTAKSWIGGALLGITLALGALLILNTISPQFIGK